MARQIKNKAIDKVLKDRGLTEIGLFKDSNGYYVGGLTSFAQDVLSHVDSPYITSHYQSGLPINSLADMPAVGWWREMDYIWYVGLQEYEKELKGKELGVDTARIAEYFKNLNSYLKLEGDDTFNFDYVDNFNIGILCDVINYAKGGTEFSKKDRLNYVEKAHDYSIKHYDDNDGKGMPFYLDRFTREWRTNTTSKEWFDLGKIVDSMFKGVFYKFEDRVNVVVDGLNRDEWDRIYSLYDLISK